MSSLHFALGMILVAASAAACSGPAPAPTGPTPSLSPLLAHGPSSGFGFTSTSSDASWGPETPHFNLEVILRGDGFGLVRFRQPNDDLLIVHLDTWVRNLAPNTSYQLQRAVDVNVDDQCTSAVWMTLGKGSQPQSIMTNASGTGRAELFRSVAAFPVGSEFDIHFRVIEEGTTTVVLTSECYQYTISQ